MNQIKELNISDIRSAYLTCALWAENIISLTIEELSDEIKEKALDQINSFLERVKMNNEAIEAINCFDEEQIGHSLWLEQARHGAGFFDFEHISDKVDALSKLTKDITGFNHLYDEFYFLNEDISEIEG